MEKKKKKKKKNRLSGFMIELKQVYTGEKKHETNVFQKEKKKPPFHSPFSLFS